MKAPVKLRSCPDQNVLCNAHTLEHAVSEVAGSLFRRSLVRNDYHDVVVAVRARLAASSRAEQIDPVRVIGFCQTPHNLSEHRVVC